MNKKLALGMLALTAIFSAKSNAIPVLEQGEIAGSNMAGIKIFDDSENYNREDFDKIFWYVPQIALNYDKAEDGTLTPDIEEITLDDGSVEFILRLRPYKPNKLENYLSSMIGSLKFKSQLKPMMLTNYEVSFMGKGGKVFKFSPPSKATSILYVSPTSDGKMLQEISLSMTADEASYFRKRLEGGGIQGNYLMYFSGSVKKGSVSVNLSCEELFKSIAGGVNAKYKVAQADLQAKVSNYISSKSGTVVITGDYSKDEVVNKIIDRCFQKTVSPATPTAAIANALSVNTPSDPLFSPNNNYNLGSPVISNQPGGQPRTLEDLAREIVIPNPPLSENEPAPSVGTTPTPSLGPDSMPAVAERPRSSAQPVTGEIGANFTFGYSKDKIKETVKYYEVKLNSDAQSIGLTFRASKKVQELFKDFNLFNSERTTFTITGDKQRANPFASRIELKDAKSVIVTAGFMPDKYWKGFAWNYEKWGNPNDYLMYRVPGHAWASVGDRALLTDIAGEGKIEFAVDKEKLYKKMSFWSGKFLIGTYAAFNPVYVVTVETKDVKLNVK